MDRSCEVGSQPTTFTQRAKEHAMGHGDKGRCAERGTVDKLRSGHPFVSELDALKETGLSDSGTLVVIEARVAFK